METGSDINLDEAVIVALGGNLPGDHDSVESLLDAAIERLDGADLRVVARSGWWRSAAWPNADDPAFINGVVLIDTGLPPGAIMAALQAVERAFGRVRGEPNAPRTLDLDLIAYGRAVLNHPDVTVPHPRAHERRFVMGPLAEIAPHWRHPVLRQTAENLARSAEIGMDAAPIA